MMKNFLDGIAYDVKFVQGHKLQPAWYKVLKIFILLGVICAFVWLFGWQRAVVFVVIFFLLSLIVHMTYRINTRKFTRNWLDFVIVEDKEKNLKQGIGVVYYAWVILNAVIAFLVSGVLAG
jgi:Ca2+-dependent lipid-binding protein